MDFLDLVKKRSSVRKYKPDFVPDEKIDMILKATRLAPDLGGQLILKPALST